MAIQEQRRQTLEAALSQQIDWAGTEVGLAQYHLQHLKTSRRSQALFDEENTLYIAFIDDLYQVSCKSRLCDEMRLSNSNDLQPDLGAFSTADIARWEFCSI